VLLLSCFHLYHASRLFLFHLLSLSFHFLLFREHHLFLSCCCLFLFDLLSYCLLDLLYHLDLLLLLYLYHLLVLWVHHVLFLLFLLLHLGLLQCRPFFLLSNCLLCLFLLMEVEASQLSLSQLIIYHVPSNF